MDMGGVLVDDNSNVKYSTSLEECAQICSEDLKTNCKSFNYCHKEDMKGTDSTCALSTKLLRDDGVTTTEKEGCKHYESKFFFFVMDIKNRLEKLSFFHVIEIKISLNFTSLYRKIPSL